MTTLASNAMPTPDDPRCGAGRYSERGPHLRVVELVLANTLDCHLDGFAESWVDGQLSGVGPQSGLEDVGEGAVSHLDAQSDTIW